RRYRLLDYLNRLTHLQFLPVPFHALRTHYYFFFHFYGPHRHAHSFPTRRSSDLSSPTSWPSWAIPGWASRSSSTLPWNNAGMRRSEEHTSELQSRGHLVCRLLLEKKKNASMPPKPSSPQSMNRRTARQYRKVRTR